MRRLLSEKYGTYLLSPGSGAALRKPMMPSSMASLSSDRVVEDLGIRVGTSHPDINPHECVLGIDKGHHNDGVEAFIIII